MSAPEAYIRWVNSHLGFNPRGQANSDALSEFVVTDLREACPMLRVGLDAGALKASKNPNVQTKFAERSIDLVLSENNEAPILISAPFG
jgi:hypothetical protein